MTTENLAFKLSETGEKVVRSYKCTSFRRWYARNPTVGFLTVTNRRVVFHSEGASLTGRSALINEMPLEDVAGLSVYEGLSLNWFQFVIFSALALFVIRIVASILPGFLFSSVVALVLMLPFLLFWLWGSRALSGDMRNQVLQTLSSVSGRQVGNPDLSRYLPPARVAFHLGLLLLAHWLVTDGDLLEWVFAVLILAYLFMHYFGKLRTFSLLVGSKTMKGSGIYIPGETFRLLATRDDTAVRTVHAGPAEDASQLMRELGALVLDLQQLGDLGIEKWKR